MLDTINLISSSGPESLGEAKYFMVPAAWMKNAWPLLTFNASSGELPPSDWQTYVGQISCSSLLGSEHSVVQQDFGSTDALSRTREAGERTAPSTSVALSMRHMQDYFLLGKNVWTLVRAKFGYDIEIACPLVREANGLWVRMGGGNKVPVPGSGRFKYHEYFNEKMGAKSVSDDDTVDPMVRKLCPDSNVALSAVVTLIITSDSLLTRSPTRPTEHQTMMLCRHRTGITMVVTQMLPQDTGMKGLPLPRMHPNRSLFIPSSSLTVQGSPIWVTHVL